MKKIKKYTLDSIAGYKDEKEELKKIIDLFNNYEVYKTKGAYMSKGLILSGDPGVGKTLFAKVLASEINAPLIILDGSDLGGLFGSLKIKKAFKKARKKSPSMIFIDELNMLAGDDGYYSDFTQRNLSCLLRQIDGIRENNDIFVVGASSYKDGLDEALLRSGRIDKHICISLPNNKSRKEIFEYYLNEKELVKDFDLTKAIELTAGMSGADIKTIVNEATLEAINTNEGILEDRQIFNAIFKVKNKDLNRNNPVSKELLYHDIGHMIVSYKLFKRFNEIMTTDNNYVGNSTVSFLEEMNRNIYDEYDDFDDETNDNLKEIFVNKNKAIDIISVYLAGGICEEIFFNDRSFNNYVDIVNAIKDITFMMGAGYFGYKFTVVNDISESKPLTGNIRELIEEEKVMIMEKAHAKAFEIINDNKNIINKIYNSYVKEDSLTKEETYELLKEIK